MAVKSIKRRNPAPSAKKNRTQAWRGLTMTSFELGNWPVLGGPVHMNLSPRRTVLVGKNGAGKSLLLEGLSEVKNRIVFGNIHGPDNFQCSFRDSLERSLMYRYEASSKPVEPSRLNAFQEATGENVSWKERCWKTSPARSLWTLSQGKATLSNRASLLVERSRSLLSITASSLSRLPVEAQALREFLLGMRMVRSGLPRERRLREAVLIPVDEAQWLMPPVSRIHELAEELYLWNTRVPHQFEEFNNLGQRLGTWRHAELRRYGTGASQDEYASITFDGTNIGHLPDGTLRIVVILVALLSIQLRTPRQKGMLLLEEPETGIHPGLLSRLLAILDSYSLDTQLVISTHSHQVVNWASPEEVRLVERRDGVTQVSALSKVQVRELVPYLEDQGTLGDFVYSGGADA